MGGFLRGATQFTKQTAIMWAFGDDSPIQSPSLSFRHRGHSVLCVFELADLDKPGVEVFVTA